MTDTPGWINFLNRFLLSFAPLIWATASAVLHSTIMAVRVESTVATQRHIQSSGWLHTLAASLAVAVFTMALTLQSAYDTLNLRPILLFSCLVLTVILLVTVLLQQVRSSPWRKSGLIAMICLCLLFGYIAVMATRGSTSPITPASDRPGPVHDSSSTGFPPTEGSR